MNLAIEYPCCPLVVTLIEFSYRFIDTSGYTYLTS